MTADQPREDAIAARERRSLAYSALQEAIRHAAMLGMKSVTIQAPLARDLAAALAPADPTVDLRAAALAGHPSPDRGSGPWVLRLVCCGYDDGIERYATWDEADMFRQAYVTGPGGHDRAAILTRDLDTTYHRRRVARRLAALDAVEEPR